MLVDESEVAISSWISTNTPIFIVCLAVFGPAVVFSPLLIFYGFTKVSPIVTALVSVVLVAMLTVTRVIFEPTFKDLILRCHIRYLPTPTGHWMLMRVFAQVLSNAFLITVIILAPILGWFYGFGDHFEVVSIKLLLFLASQFFLSDRCIGFGFSGVTQFAVGVCLSILIIESNWILFYTANVCILLSPIALRWSTNFRRYLTAKGNIILWLFIKSGVVKIYLLSLLAMGLLILTNGTSISLIASVGWGSVLLYAHCVDQGLSLFSKDYSFLRALPNAKQNLQSLKIQFVLLTSALQTCIIYTIHLWLPHEQGNLLFILLMISLLVTALTCFVYRNLRTPVLLILMLILAMESL